jgi:ketosteroid isomerase-like protein
MSDNVETIRRGYDAWNRGDLDGVRSIYAAEVTADAGALWPAAGLVSGSDAIIEAFASIFATFEESEVLADEYIERGDCVVVPTRWRGMLPGSRDVVEQRVVAAYTMRDGQVVHIGYFRGLGEAFEGTASD